MADAYTTIGIGDKKIKLIDNGDGTYSAAGKIVDGELLVKAEDVETTLAAILAKADLKSTELRDALRGVSNKTLTDLATTITGLSTLLTSIKDTDGVKKIGSALPAGSNVIGKTGVQVDGADVSAANPMPQSDANTLSGLASERPAAAAGNKGKTYWSLDTGDVSVSTGAAWRSIGVV